MADSPQVRTNVLLENAQRYIPGGTSSANRRVDPNLVFSRAQGAYLFDASGRRYIDYHAAFGPVILGHCNPEVNQRVSAVMAQIDLVGVGTNELEVQLAQKVVEHLPCAEQAIFCNSGSEATYAAIRLARAVTERKKLVKFQGCYHGWHDAVLMNVISAADKIGQKDPISAGMSAEVVENTLVLPFNDLEALSRAVEQQGEEIAAVIVEPIPHNIGCVMPHPDFLEGLRALTADHGILLIFDEVITGFRHSLGGYQQVSGVTPDLTTLGKAIANGFPIAALCGRADLLERLGPGGDVIFAGTYNANPASVAAALATIEILERPGVYDRLFTLGEKMRTGLGEILARNGVEATVAGFGSIFVTYFMAPPISEYKDLLRNDAARFVAFRREMIAQGVYMLPVNLKRNHISLAHSEADIDETLEIAETIFKRG
jgi:glutamate-1-semialdehyde 2,1-aminomutase